ncbi:MAG: hypothetical protein M0P70_08855 [Desulfobulbaceae bacterium]|nr:hypothetical protein [Desulfobulbaceae bacterium]
MTDTPPNRYNPAIHHRRSIRLQGYDYSQAGAYFITICTHNRECLFGAVGAGSKPAPSIGSKPALGPGPQDRAGLEPAPTQSTDQMALNEFGEIVQYTWDDLPNHIAGIELDAFVIMPNHIHGIIVITGAGLKQKERAGLEQKERAGLEPAPTGTRILPEIVRQLKTFSARRINRKRVTPGLPVWQRNYYEHIIRNEDNLNRIREYIANNPVNWQSDENYLVMPSAAVPEDFPATAEARRDKEARHEQPAVRIRD